VHRSPERQHTGVSNLSHYDLTFFDGIGDGGFLDDCGPIGLTFDSLVFGILTNI
jgi:hypothetical protein